MKHFWLFALLLLSFSNPVCAETSSSRCVRELSAPTKFSRLERYDGISGWLPFKFSLRSLRNSHVNGGSTKVALLVEDGRSRGGYRVVVGYIYEIETVEKTVLAGEYYDGRRHVQNRNQLRRSDTIRVNSYHKLHITTVPPQYYEANDRRTSIGWSSRPSAASFRYVNADRIHGAKYYVD